MELVNGKEGGTQLIVGIFQRLLDKQGKLIETGTVRPTLVPVNGYSHTQLAADVAALTE
jgi:hypothetical protein